MADRNLDVGFIVIRNDPETGKPYTTVLPDGKVIESPLIALNAYNLPEGTKLRFSFWDFDNSQLPTRYSAPVTDEEHQTFFQAMHDRMQAWAREGGPSQLADQRAKDDEIARLRAELAKSKAPPAND